MAEAIVSAENPLTTCVNVFEAALALVCAREVTPIEAHRLIQDLVEVLGVQATAIVPEMIPLAIFARERKNSAPEEATAGISVIASPMPVRGISKQGCFTSAMISR
jgi:hypothetical protein